MARAFSSARCSIGGVTITNTGADLQDVATLIGRTQGTKAGGDAGGSAGLLGFDSRMEHLDLDAGGHTTQSYHGFSRRNPKHTVLQDSQGQEFEVSTPLGNLLPFFLHRSVSAHFFWSLFLMLLSLCHLPLFFFWPIF